MAGGMVMTAGGMTIMYLLTLYGVTMLVLWHYARQYRPESPPRGEMPFVLLEGQTILGIIDTKNGVHFCIGNDARNKK